MATARPRIRTVIFDLDDTLIDTTPSYERVLDRFCAEVTRLLPGTADPPTARALQEEIDLRAIEAVGFGKERFPWSLAETYRVLAGRAGLPPEPAVEARMQALGEEVFAQVPALMPGARALLGKLRGQVELLLYTLGVQEVQAAKVEHHGFDQLFDEVHIVHRKTVAALKAVVGARDPAAVMVVGDSLRGEIGPALELGCRAVLVKRPICWRYHDMEVAGRYEAIEDLTALGPLLELR